MDDYPIILIIIGAFGVFLISALFVFCFLDCTGMLDEWLYGGGPDD